MRTSVLAAKRALRTMLLAEDALDGLLIRIGLPAEEPVLAERAYVLDNQPREYQSMSEQGGLAEAYVVPILLETKAFGDLDHSETSRDEAEDRMEDLCEVVVSMVQADRELAGTVHDATVERIIGPNTAPTTDGWISQVTIEVGIGALIYG